MPTPEAGREQLLTGDGARLALRVWPVAKPTAVVVIVHGLGEHSGRYAHVAAALNEARFAVTAADHRGHGESPGKRGHAEWSQLLDDLGRVVEHARQSWPGAPVFLYGHSLGGALVVRYGQQRGEDLAGIVASAPAFRPAFEPPAWKLRVARLLAGVWKSLTMHNELDLDALCRDPAAVRDYTADPLTHDRISVALALGTLVEGERALAEAALPAVPILLVHGDADRLTSFDATRCFAEAAGDRAALLVVPDGYHEPHHDPGHERVLQQIVEWIAERAKRSRDSPVRHPSA